MATVEELKQQYANYNTDRIDAVNNMYDAQKQSQLSQLESAYNQSKSAQQAAKDKISPTYQQKANDLAVQYERNRRNFNQQAAGNGINTGTASQAALAQNSTFQRDYGRLRGEEADAITAADRGLADLETAYQNNIRAAAAENDYKRAAALLDEYKNQYSRDLQRAQTLASFGDFSGYSTIYGDTEANNMFNAWKASNPDLAYRTGRIGADEYYRMTGSYPAGYSAPASSGGGGGWYGGGGGSSSSDAGDLSALNGGGTGTSSGGISPAAKGVLTGINAGLGAALGGGNTGKTETRGDINRAAASALAKGQITQEQYRDITRNTR